MPARYVVGRDRVILYAEVNPDYTHRPEPEGMLPALRAAANRTAASSVHTRTPRLFQ